MINTNKIKYKTVKNPAKYMICGREHVKKVKVGKTRRC